MSSLRILLLALCIVSFTKAQAFDSVSARLPENTVLISLVQPSSTLYVYLTHNGEPGDLEILLFDSTVTNFLDNSEAINILESGKGYPVEAGDYYVRINNKNSDLQQGIVYSARYYFDHTKRQFDYDIAVFK
jgi:hypothetical protein